MKIGLGGEANWDSHVKSAAHVRLEGSATQKASASRFFSKFLPKARSARVDAASSSTSDIPTAISPTLGNFNTPEPPTSPDLEVLSTIDLSETASVPPTSPSPTTETFDISPMFSPPGELQDLLTRLRMTSKALPVSVPEGTIDDELANLSGDFSLEVANVEPDEVWEYINKATDRVFGYGMGTQELSVLIRRGQYGMDGVCDWLERAVIKLGSEAILLQGRIGRLIDAMELLSDLPITILARTSSFHPSTQTDSQTSDVSGKSAVIAVRIRKTVPVSSPALSSLSLPCPGYCLPIPDGQLAIGTYPFAMHMSPSVPWCVSIKGTDVVLHSDDCTQLGGDHATPCLPCRSLHNNSTIMGIRHRAIDGAPEKTPYHYLAPSHAINSLRRKDVQIKHLRRQAMNNLRSLTTQNHQLEGWKRFALAISRTDIPRLNSLTAAALHDGAGVFGLLKKVDQAARHVYSPKGYQKVDFEKGVPYVETWRSKCCQHSLSYARVTFH